ncbi:MAG: adenylyltransferase/cytidyltransferase family protein [Nanoarchaeota archaeon]|nr:adenylyltransferase/cytidyltransferase family protein [Nanoarchaeota archaeon]MBU1643873.1 adenylyltransferase/cytidyltransferase family protein [Nanoarchaeota archaeon]MBU1977216.1 adenylyltransferase/cytidyltransferase family protein [Nanoarchaeota archaeon]
MKKNKVMCFGTFDLLHLGHLNYLKEAKKLGHYLIVVIARDKTKEKESKKLIFSEGERLEIIQSLKMVDEAVLGSLENHFKIILEKKPDLICLGYDHKIKEEELKERLNELNLDPEIRRMKPYHAEKYKSTLIRKNIFEL